MLCNEDKTKCHVNCFPEGTTYFIQHLHCCCGNGTSQPSSGGNPIGTIIAYPAAKIPTEYLKCDGAEIERAEYAELFEIIGETYGAGDGSTTFNLPDLRGEFIRGLDEGREIDSGRVLGSGQKGTLTAVDAVVLPNNTVKQLTTVAVQVPSASTDYNEIRKDSGMDMIDIDNYARTGATFQSPADTGTVFAPVSVGMGATRPRNVAMIYCIKAK